MAKYIIEFNDSENLYNGKEPISVLVASERGIAIKSIVPYEESKQKIPERWRAKAQGYYWYVDALGNVSYVQDDGIGFDNWKYISGNYFQTEEEAEDYKESLIVYNELKEYAEPEDVAWDGAVRHYYISWDCQRERLKVLRDTVFRRGLELYFASRENAWTAIEAAGVDKVKRFYLGIKEQRDE